MALNDSALVQILWMRRLFYEADQSGAIQFMGRLTNLGSNPWASPQYRIRPHLFLADGTYVRNPAGGTEIFGTLDPGEYQTITGFIHSAPQSPSVSVAQLFSPDTTVVLGLVQEGVEWISQAGIMRVADCLDQVNANFQALAARGELLDSQAYGVDVPTSGDTEVISPMGLGRNLTLYLVNAIVTAQGDQRVAAYIVRQPGFPDERALGLAYVPDRDVRVLDLGLTKVSAEQPFRMVVSPNADGGRVEVTLNFIRLPWTEGAIL